jgi:hypothetical protein
VSGNGDGDAERNGHDKANGQGHVEGLLAAVPVSDGVRTDAPIWETTRRPAWVKAVNAAGAVARGLGVRWPRVDPETLLRLARRRTGLGDFGDDRFRGGLAALVDAFEAQGTAHAFGRLFFREYCVSLLVNRLKIADELRRHPEILGVPVPRPLVITGLPRSGTTFLHRLMSEDPAGRTMLFWEALEPAPPPARETYATDPRIARARRSMELLYRLSPRLATAHEFDAESPEEDNNLFAHEFAAGILGFMFDVPDFVRWLDRQDLVPGYRSMKRQLQLLSWKYRGDYWVLKAPAHLFGLDALLEVFPDANIVVTHRDPLQVIPSLCSLAAGFRGILTDRLDLRRLGAEFAEAMAVGPRRAIAARAAADPSRFFDVSYRRLTADPVGTVRDACARFGYDFTPAYEARVRRRLADHPQHKHGVHRYHLADFGLDAPSVNRHFDFYREWLAGHLPQAV